MGMNVHFQYHGEGQQKPIPEELGCENSLTLPRYIVRLKDFVAAREKTKHLQPIWQKVLDYMESEPKAYIQY
jgi:hypothetical protein